MIATFIHDWFGFPNGSVLTNLVATGICVLAGTWKVILIVRKWQRSHRELHLKLDRMHESNESLHTKLDEGHASREVLHDKLDRLHHLGIDSVHNDE